MVTIKGFLTNLGKYNEGVLLGKWVEFPMTNDKFVEELHAIGVDGVQYEEYFFTDWEYTHAMVNLDLDFGEYQSVQSINGAAEFLLELEKDGRLEAFVAMTEVFGVPVALTADYDDVSLYPDVHDDHDLGFYWVEESGIYDLNAMGTLASYIDYERLGRDIRLESNGGFSAYGWLEWVD